MQTEGPKNQLDQVICQLRFPARLSVERDVDRFQVPFVATIRNTRSNRSSRSESPIRRLQGTYSPRSMENGPSMSPRARSA